MYKLVPINEVEIRLQARSAGDYGFIRTYIERTPQEEYRVHEEIISQIKRHVDGVGWTNIEQKHLYETEDGEQFETLYELLEHLYDEDGCGSHFEIRHHHPNQQYGTRSYYNSFERVIEEAYRNPYNFEVVRGALTEEQRNFLTRVVDASLDEKMLKEAKSNAQA